MVDSHSPRSFQVRLASFITSLLPFVALLGLLGIVLTPLFLVPAEDATILFQYSDNWATTGQITYFTGGPRVEGATDFLWMALLTVFRLVHVPAYFAVAALNFVAVLVIAYLLLRLSGRKPTATMILIPAGLVILIPQIGAALAGFSVLPFAALLLSCVYFYHFAMDIPLALACLVLCLFRPDGVVFAAPLLGLRLLAAGPKVWWKLTSNTWWRLATYIAFFVVPGIAYFVWRWRYFGELLPIPFLVKSDVRRFLGVAVSDSNIDILKYLGFDIALLILLFGRRLKERTNFQVLLAIGIVPTLFYLTMRLDQDIADRFFAYLLICAAALVAMNWDKLPRTRTILVSASLWCIFLAFTWGYWLIRFVSDGYRNNVVAIASELNHVHPNGTLALSEAGRIAYFSRWKTTDLWGLNTPEYAHHLFSPADVAKVSPDLLVLYYPQSNHDCRLKAGWDTPYTVRVWPNMARNVITGLNETGSYELWMVPSSGLLRKAMHGNRPGAGEYQCWFLKRDYAGHDQVADILARHAALPAQEFFHIRFGQPIAVNASAQSADTSK